MRRDLVLACMDSPLLLVATVMVAPHPFADRIKARPDVEVIEIGPHNRNRLPADLANKLMKLKSSQGEE